MSTNSNIQMNLLELYNLVVINWKKKRGLSLIIMIELVLSIVGYYKFKELRELSPLFFPILITITLVLWSIKSGRYFQRYVNFRYLSCLISTTVSLICYFFLYPSYIKGGDFDFTGFQLLISLLSFTFLTMLGLFIPFIIKSKDLVIVFLVSNESKFEDRIMKTLNETKYKIEKEDSNIRIIIPSFGIAQSISECEDYIHSCFNHADAVIYARMLDSDSDEFGYCFTDFTSRMGNHFLEKEKSDVKDIQNILTEEQKVNSWNTLNSSTDNITTKVNMSNQLSEMLLLYVSSIYLYKKRYTEAVNVAQKLFDIKTSRSSVVTDSTMNVLAHAYLVAEQSEESVNHNYEQAYNMLVQCENRIPFIRTLITYQLALARIFFLKGDIAASKKITKSLHSKKEFQWYTSINLAFYAIYEKKPLEVLVNYKRLCKVSVSPNYDEVKFAIDFLNFQFKSSTDSKYQMYLLHGIAFLYLYLDKNESNKIIRKLEKKYINIPDYNRLEDVRKLISVSYDKLKMRNDR